MPNPVNTNTHATARALWPAAQVPIVPLPIAPVAVAINALATMTTAAVAHGKTLQMVQDIENNVQKVEAEIRNCDALFITYKGQLIASDVNMMSPGLTARVAAAMVVLSNSPAAAKIEADKVFQEINFLSDGRKLLKDRITLLNTFANQCVQIYLVAFSQYHNASMAMAVKAAAAAGMQ